MIKTHCEDRKKECLVLKKKLYFFVSKTHIGRKINPENNIYFTDDAGLLVVGEHHSPVRRTLPPAHWPDVLEWPAASAPTRAQTATTENSISRLGKKYNFIKQKAIIDQLRLVSNQKLSFILKIAIF